MIEAAEVEVVAAGVQTGSHRVEVDPVARRVDEHVRADQRRRERALASGVNRGGGRLAHAVSLRDGGRALRVEVQQVEGLDLVRLGEVPDDRRRDRPARAQHGDPHRTSSRARSASQSSMRSVARERSRPVSSSIFRIP